MSASTSAPPIGPRGPGSSEAPETIQAKSTRHGLWKWFVLSLAGLVVLVLLAVAALFMYSWWDARVSPDIQGRVVIYGLNKREPGEACHGGLFYPGIQTGWGGLVEAYDSRTGKVVGRGSFDEGTWVDDACVFPFSIPNVDDAESYRISVGLFPSRSLTISREELERRDWRVQFVFGKPPSGGGT